MKMVYSGIREKCFELSYRCKFLRFVPYIDEPVGRVKMQTTNKNIQQYYTPKQLIRKLLSNRNKSINERGRVW